MQHPGEKTSSSSNKFNVFKFKKGFTECVCIYYQKIVWLNEICGASTFYSNVVEQSTAFQKCLKIVKPCNRFLIVQSR